MKNQTAKNQEKETRNQQIREEFQRQLDDVNTHSEQINVLLSIVTNLTEKTELLQSQILESKTTK